MQDTLVKREDKNGMATYHVHFSESPYTIHLVIHTYQELLILLILHKRQPVLAHYVYYTQLILYYQDKLRLVYNIYSLFLHSFLFIKVDIESYIPLRSVTEFFARVFFCLCHLFI